MAQVKIYGLGHRLLPVRHLLSEVIHSCVVDALQFPPDKRAHRFFPMEAENMYFPAGRSDAYMIIEITMIAGRSVTARKRLVHLLFERIGHELNIAANDIEICIMESPACNWGFRGMHGDEVTLNYRIDV